VTSDIAIAPDAAAPEVPPPAAPMRVAPAAVNGPGAELRLELTDADEIVVATAAKREPPRRPARDQDILAGAAIRARASLVALSHRYRPDPAAPPFGILDADKLCLDMAAIGAELHEAFFGHPDANNVDADLKRIAKAIADTPAPARLQIGAAYQPFPWAVLYDGVYRGKDPASVDLASFWGHRFHIDRAIVGHVSAAHAPVIRTPVRVQPCRNRTLETTPHDPFPRQTTVVRPSIESGNAFRDYLKTQPSPCDLLYVFCHASAAVTRDALFTFAPDAPETQAKLIFEPPPAEPVDVQTMRKLRRTPLADRPLVFLNACSTAAGDEAFQGQFLEQFLDAWSAGGLIGTDWDVPQAFAEAFATRMLGYFLAGGITLGDAFARTTRDAFAQRNPFALVYAMYAAPDLIVGGTT
jgi:hypothetical protein